MANIGYFEIPADNVDRAKHFYTSLLGWKIEPTKAPLEPEKMAMIQYQDIATGKPAEGQMSMGGLYKRQMNETIRNYVLVADIDAALAKVEKLGGRILMQKEMIRGVGQVAIIQDTEGNGIGIWKPLQ